MYNQFYQNKAINKGINSVLSGRDIKNTGTEYYFEALGSFLDQKNLNESSSFISYLNTDADYKDAAMYR